MKALLVALFSLLPVFAADAPAGKTWALVVGISQFQKLPNDLWLQYPDSDARTFSQFLSSPRGGSVPADQILLLTNDKATTKALRSAFQTFLKDKPGKNDTVYILIASHGTVDAQGAYILTYDSDPANLSTSALPMGELHSMVEDELNHTARVVFLADVCRAATIAGQKTAALADAVAGLKAPGEMLGLMAARPKELSMESPEYGGGHGAFTYSVLKGLSGDADSDKDGFVTAGELIDYVSTEVPKITAKHQHPRDFGDIENTTKLADLSKPGIALN